MREDIQAGGRLPHTLAVVVALRFNPRHQRMARHAGPGPARSGGVQARPNGGNGRFLPGTFQFRETWLEVLRRSCSRVVGLRAVAGPRSPGPARGTTRIERRLPLLPGAHGRPLVGSGPAPCREPRGPPPEAGIPAGVSGHVCLCGGHGTDRSQGAVLAGRVAQPGFLPRRCRFSRTDAPCALRPWLHGWRLALRQGGRTGSPRRPDRALGSALSPRAPDSTGLDGDLLAGAPGGYHDAAIPPQSGHRDRTGHQPGGCAGTFLHSGGQKSLPIPANPPADDRIRALCGPSVHLQRDRTRRLLCFRPGKPG